MNLGSLFKNKVTVATHNGTFHADDVFAVATLSIWAEREGKVLKVVRTRDPEIINKADIVLDVGNIYDPEKNRFDHHQREGAGDHDNGIPYASFGLIWKHYAEKITSKEIALIIENKLVMPIDAGDNGLNIYDDKKFDISEYTMDDAFDSIKESGGDLYDLFIESVDFSKKILEGEVNKAKFKIEGERATLAEMKKQGNPVVLVLEKYVSWQNAVMRNKNTKFVIYKDKEDSQWCAQSVRDDVNLFDSNRAKFPENWRGLRDLELSKTSGIPGAVFCHSGGWFAVANSKESALEMAKKALECYNTKN